MVDKITNNNVYLMGCTYFIFCVSLDVDNMFSALITQINHVQLNSLSIELTVDFSIFHG